MTTFTDDLLGSTENPVFADTADGDLVEFNPTLTPHLLVSGATGTEKSQALRTLIASAATHGWGASAIDVAKGGTDFADLAQFLERDVATDLDSANETLMRLYGALKDRRGLLDLHRVEDFESLPAEARPARKMIVIDILNYLISNEPVPERTGDPDFDAEFFAPATAANITRSKIRTLLKALLEDGPQVGISVVLSAQRVSEEARQGVGLYRTDHRLARLVTGSFSAMEHVAMFRDPESVPPVPSDAPKGTAAYEVPGVSAGLVQVGYLPQLG